MGRLVEVTFHEAARQARAVFHIDDFVSDAAEDRFGLDRPIVYLLRPPVGNGNGAQEGRVIQAGHQGGAATQGNREFL